MTKLANIFDGAEGEGPRGVDLHATVEVPKRALGRIDGHPVEVPLQIAGVPRADPHGDGRRVRLHLPATLPAEGAMLRLRGLGGLVTEEGESTRSPGDLYLRVHLATESTRRPWLWIALGVAAAAATTLALLSS